MSALSALSAPILTLLVAMSLAAAAPAWAQAFPQRPIRVVIPFPPGGPTDFAARALGSEMAAELGQTLVMDNRAGAAGLIAAQMVAGSAPDGHTLLFSGAGAFGINPALFAGRLPYDAQRDFTPVVLVISSPNLISANPRFAGSTMADLIRIARQSPGKLNVGVGSLGTTQHMAVELLKMMSEIQLTIVPYKGAALGMQDLIGGNIDVLSDGIASSLPQVRAGRIKALAVTSAARASIAAEIPAVAETLPGFAAISWFGLSGPAKLAPDRVNTLNRAANAALNKPALRERYASAGLTIMGGTPVDAAAHIGAELKRWADVVRVTGAKAE
jgi:tripartite-type tricarboxylate transporter receptor subunit TctC